MNKDKATNRLTDETSPYLLQHAHNPVNWYPWGKEALEKAGKEDKLILVSVGYSACHWCHVMEKESFEDEEIAHIMNESFVCIKVDREERPDVDQVYMDAVNMISGSGGWPLNCFALPDGRPVFGGTYFRKEQWKNVLTQLSVAYKNEKSKFIKAAEEVNGKLVQHELIEKRPEEDFLSKEDFNEIIKLYKGRFDKNEGGYLGAPKFPLPNSWEFVLQYGKKNRDNEALEQVMLTLNKLALSGTYDQLAGGFARYATDNSWKIPHFEKMLYDNAQLISLYSKAYQLTKKPLYKKIAFETIEFIKREMSSMESGFYSAYDADSEGEEGKYYVWTSKEIKEISGKNAPILIERYGVTEEGNMEPEKNILHTVKSTEEVAKKLSLKNEQTEEILDQLHKELYKARSKRIKPALDDKILASWNSLMLKALADAFLVFREEQFLEQAMENYSFLTSWFIKEDGSMFRNYKNGKTTINAFLDDYALTVEALLRLYQASFKEEMLWKADQLIKYVLEHFYNDDSGLFYFTSNLDDPLAIRKTEIVDNVIPSANSVMANNLFTMGIYMYNNHYLELSSGMLGTLKDKALKYGNYFSNWHQLALKMSDEPYEIAIVGKESVKMAREMQDFDPELIISATREDSDLPILKDRSPMNNQTTIFVCRNKVCKIPVTTVEEALEQLKHGS